MFGKKKLTNLAKNDLEELMERTKLAQEHILTAQALELQKKVWLNGCLKKLGLDTNKQYIIDPKDGAIRENEPQGNQKNP